MTRFFVAHEDMQTDRFSLTGDNAAHAKVLRLKCGESVVVCDGQGQECLCRIENIDPKQVDLLVQNRYASQTEASIQEGVNVILSFTRFKYRKNTNIIHFTHETGESL